MSLKMTFPQYKRHIVVYNGSPLRIRPGPLEVLLMHMLRRGHIISNAEMVEMVWPDPDLQPDWGANIISIYYSYLNKRLPNLLVKYNRRGYCLPKDASKSTDQNLGTRFASKNSIE